MEFLPIGWKDYGAGGLIALVFIFMLLGRLIPRPWHRERIADKEAQLVEKDARIKFLEAALEKRDEQLSQQIANNTVAVNALEALRREAARA